MEGLTEELQKLIYQILQGETVLVPGKVLSNGDLTEKVNVAAFKFSQKAQEKIESAGGECVSIDDIMESNPKGSNIRIME